MSWDDVQSLTVTQEDIGSGRPGRGDSCPIAIAANRAFGVDDAATFNETWDGWLLSIYEMRWHVDGGSDFAVAFDGGEPVKPSTFALERLDDVYEDAEDES